MDKLLKIDKTGDSRLLKEIKKSLGLKLEGKEVVSMSSKHAIKDVMKKYKNEWLLIKVTVVDDQDQPAEGEIISHSKNRDEIYDAQKKFKGDLYITYSGKMPKKGYAVAFYG